MAFNFDMPRFGLTMEEGEITRWFKAVGDKVAKGEPLVEVETDKITNEVESPYDGVVLNIAYEEGSNAPVGATLAIIGAEGESFSVGGETAPAVVETKEVAQTEVKAPISTTTQNSGFSSPAARKLAKEEGLDINSIPGTGPNGRVIEKDVYKAKMSPLAKKMAVDSGLTPAQVDGVKADGQRVMAKDVAAIVSPQKSAPVAKVAPAVQDGGEKLKGMRKAIAKNMSESWNKYPMVTMDMDTDMTECKAMKAKLTAATGNKYSYTEIIAKAVAVALQEYPDINCSLIDDKVYKNDSVNVGIAVSLDNGLVVPVIKDVQAKSVTSLSKEIKGKIALAREGKLSPDDMKGGSITVSNLGGFGVDHFTPIINSPESAILGVCTMKDKPVVIDGEIVVRPMMNLCLTIDHRMIDGVLGAKFLGKIRELLQNPIMLF